MPKKSKLKTPDWILEGYDSEEEYNKKHGIRKKKSIGKGFKIRECPKCHSDEVSVVLTGEEGNGSGEWECRKCKWKGRDIKERELNEEEFVEYMEERKK